MTEGRKTIIERVQKLLDLEQGAKAIGSLEEAANAAEKAQKLLMKHNLEMADIAAHDPNQAQKMGRATFQDVVAQKNEGQWIYRLYYVLAEHNFCDIVYTAFIDDNGKKNKYVNLIGTKDNVQVVKFLADQLEPRLRVLEKEAWKTGRLYGEKRNAFRRGYFMGAAQGIGAQLADAKKKMMRESDQVYGLVVANDQALAQAVSELFPHLKKGRRSRGLSAQIGGSMGYNDGKNISIHKGMGNGSNPQGALE